MKYFNKEWYKSKDDMEFRFTICSGAERFSEATFTKEYMRSLKIFLKTYNYLDENEAKKIFEDMYKNHLKLFSTYFPIEILNKVADVRMLALKKVSADNLQLIQKYADEKYKNNKEITKKYKEEYDKIKDKLPKNIQKNLNLHDCLITNVIKEKNRFIIKLDSSSSYTDVRSIIFEEYEIIEEEIYIIDGWLLYEEIYIVNDKYEMHFIIDKPNKQNKSNLGYFTIRASNIIFE